MASDVSVSDWLDGKIAELEYATVIGKQMWGKNYQHDDLEPLRQLRRLLKDISVAENTADNRGI